VRAAIVLLLGSLALPCAADTPAFAAIALHDVVDTERELDADAITTDRLVGLLEWMKASGVRAVSLDDIEAASHGTRSLPDRAVLLTFDDGYRSLYTRVFPLILAYRVPIVASLVGEWMDAPMDSTVNYDGANVPRTKFISWDEAREMAASGLVEFGSHGYALHRGVASDALGTQLPAAIARRFDPRTGYETHAGYVERIASDLARSRELMRRELGRAPRALAWPYGRYRADTLQAAQASGFTLGFTLEQRPANPATPMMLARHFPQGNPALGNLAAAIRNSDRASDPPVFACVDPGQLAGNEFEARLGQAIERVRRLGATAAAIAPFEQDAHGVAGAAWFATGQMSVRADILARIAWQLHTRAGVRVHLRVPRLPKGLDKPERLGRLVDDLAAATWIDGVAFDGPIEQAFSGAIVREYPAATSTANLHCVDEARR
jgi:biofilm PGA synthesis lipoprotein PgaB